MKPGPTITVYQTDDLYHVTRTPCGETSLGIIHSEDLAIQVRRALAHARECDTCQAEEAEPSDTDHAKLRAELDAAIAAALPLAGSRVRGALHRLRNELARVDQQRAKEQDRGRPSTSGEAP